MKARNVIISLIFVLALLVFIFIKIRNEPRKKLNFNRNPSRIEYSKFAMCRMECYSINANSVSAIFSKGIVHDRKSKPPCTTFKVSILTKQGKNIFIIADQCGTVAKVMDCYISNSAMPCECTDDAGNGPVSYLNEN